MLFVVERFELSVIVDERFELSVDVVDRLELSAICVLLEVDILRLSLAEPPLLAATWAPDALLVVGVLVVDRLELSVDWVVVDMFRLSCAVAPLLAATWAPTAPDERSELSETFVDRFELSVDVRAELSA